MAKCRSCEAPMVWVKTAANGRLMPLDPKPVPDGNVVLLASRDEQGVRLVRVLAHGEDPGPDAKRYISHFATCPSPKPRSDR